MPSELARRIVNAYYPPEEFVLVIVYASLGYGKSAYQFKVTVEALKSLYHIGDDLAWDTLKSMICFHPEQFFQKLDESRELGFDKTSIINWDDAGLWLYAMDWDDPFIEAFTKWLNVARTDLTCLICSTPSPTFIFKKLRDFPSAITVQITKHGFDREHLWLREAKGYLHYVLPDLKKTRVRPLFADRFTCKMPENFFKWYQPIRDTYAAMAQRLMKEKWGELKARGKSKVFELSEYPEMQLPHFDPRKLRFALQT